MFHVFSLVCFLIYGVKRRQVLIAKPRFLLLFFQNLHLLDLYQQIYDFFLNINDFLPRPESPRIHNTRQEKVEKPQRVDAG